MANSLHTSVQKTYGRKKVDAMIIMSFASSFSSMKMWIQLEELRLLTQTDLGWNAYSIIYCQPYKLVITLITLTESVSSSLKWDDCT